MTGNLIIKTVYVKIRSAQVIQELYEVSSYYKSGFLNPNRDIINRRSVLLYFRLGRLIEQLNGKGTDVGIKLKCEWTNWVRDEFKLRKNESDEAIIKMLISQGKRQMDELERSIRIANG